MTEDKSWVLLKAIVDQDYQKVRRRIRTEQKAIEKGAGNAEHQENLYGQLTAWKTVKAIIKAIEKRDGYDRSR